MLDGIFIDAPTREGFLSMLNGGEVDKASIAFIKDTKEIWTLGVFYNCNGLTAQEITNLVQQLVLLILDENPGIKESDVINIIKNQVAEWALKSNTSTIPINKLPNSLVRIGIVDPINNTFYSNKGIEDPTSGNLYIDLTNYKCYIYLSGKFKLVGGTDFDPSSLNLATIATSGNLKDGIDDSNHKLVTLDQINSWEAKVSNIKSDWNAALGADSEILNKPTLVNIIKINGSSKQPTTNKKNEIDLGNVVLSIKLNDNILNPTGGLINLGNILTSTALNSYYTKTEIDNKHYLTEQQPVDWTAEEGTDTSILNKPLIGSGTINIIYTNPETLAITNIGNFDLDATYNKGKNIDLKNVITPILEYINGQLSLRLQNIENRLNTCCPLENENLYYFGKNSTNIDLNNYKTYLALYGTNEIPEEFAANGEYIDILVPVTIDNEGVTQELSDFKVLDQAGNEVYFRKYNGILTSDNKYKYYRSNTTLTDPKLRILITYNNV